VLYDVSPLYFETDTGDDGFREPSFSTNGGWNRRSPLGCSLMLSGFPLTVEAFEGNKAEPATLLPVINACKAAHELTDATVVADPG